MFTQFLRTLPARALFFVVVILLDPYPSMGMGGLFDDEERRREGSSRPLTVLQSLVVDFRKMMEEDMDPDLYCLDTPSKIQAFVITFMREQGFSISSEQTGHGAGVAIRMSVLFERQTQYEREVAAALPSSMSLSAYSTLMNSSRFNDLLDDSAYAWSLKEWQLKLHPQVPYTSFLPGVVHTRRMIVLAPHPLDIPATREFLSLLYEALRRLNEIDPKSSIPEHEGLRKIFSVVLEHPDDKENVLSIWGLPLLGRLGKFYNEQRVIIAWEYMVRGLAVAMEEFEKSSRTIDAQLSYVLGEMAQMEERYAVPTDERLANTLKPEEHSQEEVEKILARWKEKLFIKIKEAERAQPGVFSAVRRLNVQQQVDYHLSIARLKIKERKAPKRELTRIQAAFALVEYFSSRPWIQFSNPFQVRRDLPPLYAEFSRLPNSKSPSLAPLYRTLKDLLSFTFPQIERFSRNLDSLFNSLPPLILVAAEHQEDMRRAYQGDQNSNACVSIYAKEVKEKEEALQRFENTILQEALTYADTQDKQRYMLLERKFEKRRLETLEQEELQRLRRRILDKEIARHDSPRWGEYNMGHLICHRELSKIRFVYDIFKLRARRSFLAFEYIKRSFLVGGLGASEAEGEIRSRLDGERRRFMTEGKTLAESIKRIQVRAQHVAQEYERRIAAVQRIPQVIAE